jgi:hypothetical protein
MVLLLATAPVICFLLVRHGTGSMRAWRRKPPIPPKQVTRSAPAL